METYRFTSLNSIADYLDNQARSLRASMIPGKPNSLRNIEKREKAAAYESISNMLRKTQLDAKAA